jgi:hypothetical protein
MEPQVLKILVRLEQFESDMRSAARSKLEPADRLALAAFGLEKVASAFGGVKLAGGPSTSTALESLKEVDKLLRDIDARFVAISKRVQLREPTHNEVLDAFRFALGNSEALVRHASALTGSIATEQTTMFG